MGFFGSTSSPRCHFFMSSSLGSKRHLTAKMLLSVLCWLSLKVVKSSGKKPTRRSQYLMSIGLGGKSIIEVFNSIVTAPAAFAAGILAVGAAAEKILNEDEEELKVFTVLISVFRGNELIF